MSDLIINYRRNGSNPFDFNKKLWFFKLNDEFFNCKKSYIDIESKTLNKWISKQNNHYLNKVSGIKEKGIKGMDKFLLYELDVCIGTELNIDDLDLVIEQRINSKLKEYRDKLNWDWLGEKSKKKILNKLFDEEKFINRYKLLLNQKYQTIKSDLEYLKDGQYFELSSDYFRRDNYGYRIYNIYSRCIREFRDFIKIDGEDTVEVDLKNSMISVFYYFIKLLNDENKNLKIHLIKEIYHKLIKLNEGEINDSRLGLLYLDRWEYIKNYGDKVDAVINLKGINFGTLNYFTLSRVRCDITCEIDDDNRESTWLKMSGWVRRNTLLLPVQPCSCGVTPVWIEA